MQCPSDLGSNTIQNRSNKWSVCISLPEVPDGTGLHLRGCSAGFITPAKLNQDYLKYLKENKYYFIFFTLLNLAPREDLINYCEDLDYRLHFLHIPFSYKIVYIVQSTYSTCLIQTDGTLCLKSFRPCC